jgi:hypothetical protein
MLRVKLSYFFLSKLPLSPVPKKDNVMSTIKPKITFAVPICELFKV